MSLKRTARLMFEKAFDVHREPRDPEGHRVELIEVRRESA
jgi:hypothetical protein